MTFIEALRLKYASGVNADDGGSHGESGQSGEFTAEIQSSSEEFLYISGKEVEEVGFEKINRQLAQLHELRIIILDQMRMWNPDVRGLPLERSPPTLSATSEDLSETCPKIVDLDLSRNLFEEWREPMALCTQLKNLRSLRADLSGDMLPTTINSLTLEDNHFKTLGDLLTLTKLPNLRSLNLKKNAIAAVTRSDSDVTMPTMTNADFAFSASLTSLDISYNDITRWSFIDDLHVIFPGLTSLRVSHNPLYQNLKAADDKLLSAEDGYMLTIARLSRLKTLNFSPVTPKERLNAETYYLSQIATELSLNPKDQEARIIAGHRRYAELCDEYGEPTIRRSDAKSDNPNSLAVRLIRLTFRLNDSARRAAGDDRPPEITLEVPRSFSVYSVLGLVGKRTGLVPMTLRLIWETGEWDPVASKYGDDDAEYWNSSDEDTDEAEGWSDGRTVLREEELVAGTRMVGTWIEASEAVVRVELK
ncbi:hypothetical protein LTR04_006756 [Oleoguttula sp. CCFEE 6159]|nr:hypothetical protein LTR04_006756 [Oleoguttula sp. CCFEE 6159]